MMLILLIFNMVLFSLGCNIIRNSLNIYNETKETLIKKEAPCSVSQCSIPHPVS